MLFDCKLLPCVKHKIGPYRNYSGLPFTKSPSEIIKTHYDQFVTNGYEYIILNVHTVLAGGKNLLIDNGFTISGEYKIRNLSINIAYRSTTLPNTYNKKHNIIMCVMVSDVNSIEEVDFFIKFYKKQGVDKIFLFYCDDITKMPCYPQDEIVEYLEWNFQPSFIGNVHYLQVPLYNMFLKKYSMNSKWTIFCDLDEYIISSRFKSIKQHLLKKYNHTYTVHKLAHVDLLSKIVNHEKHVTVKDRGKSIIRGSLIKPHHIASVHRMLHARQDGSLLMFHNNNKKWKDFEKRSPHNILQKDFNGLV